MAELPEPAGEPVVVYTVSAGLSAFPEAALIKSQLDAAGFVCEMLNAHHTSMVLGGAIAIGIRIIVPASQAQAAREFLRDSGHTQVLGPME